MPESAVTAQTDLEEMENYEDAVTLAGSAKLPFGTLVWCSDDAVAACLLPTETAKPLAEVGLLDLSSAECTTIIEHAVGEAEGFEIYDVRANSAGVVWTEADILDNVWRVYAASLSGTTLGEPQLLDEGDVNWEMPTLAVAGGYAFWQRLPQLDGNARVEDSQLLRAAFGTADVPGSVRLPGTHGLRAHLLWRQSRAWRPAPAQAAPTTSSPTWTPPPARSPTPAFCPRP